MPGLEEEAVVVVVVAVGTRRGEEMDGGGEVALGWRLRGVEDEAVAVVGGIVGDVMDWSG